MQTSNFCGNIFTDLSERLIFYNYVRHSRLEKGYKKNGCGFKKLNRGLVGKKSNFKNVGAVKSRVFFGALKNHRVGR